MGQNNRALLLRIFLTLLTIDAIPGMRKGIEPLESNFVSTLVALSETFRRTIEAAQGFVDVPKETAFLTRK